MNDKDFTMRLCGQDIVVKVRDSSDWNEAAMGRMIEIKGQISLRKGMPETVYHSTLLHEVLHFIASTNQLKGTVEDESTISTLANGLLAWMRDNPNIIKKIITPKVVR